MVRMAKQRRPFDKSYMGEWSEEIFKIETSHSTDPVTYEVKDLDGDDIKGRFYEFELQRVTRDSDAPFEIERILKTRKRNGRIEHLVQWRGYPLKSASWVNELIPIKHDN